MDLIELLLLALLVVCGIATCVSRNLMVSLIIFMAYSVTMSSWLTITLLSTRLSKSGRHGVAYNSFPLSIVIG